MTETALETIRRDSIISFPFLGLRLNPPASFRLFGTDIYLYGVIIALAFLTGIIYCTRKSRQCGLQEDDVYDVLIWMIPFAILGARLYFVLFHPDYYLANPREIFAVWEGGLAVYGGVIAGVCTVAAVCRKKKLPLPRVADLLITACLLGQGIGRWGNFTNREAFGTETDIFCRMGLTDPAGNTIYVHPTFLYESLWDLAGFFILNALLNGRKKYDGECFYFYCLWYGTGRAAIEGLRTDSLYIPGTAIRVSQLLSVILALFGAVMLILRNKKMKMKLKRFVKEYWAVIAVFLLCTAVLGLFCSRKKGLFIDEVYTYGLSNSFYSPYISDLHKEGLEDQVFTAEEIDSYLTVSGGDGFSFRSVYYNQTRDVHPPLYYWLFHLVSSLFPGRFTFLTGTGLNSVLFLVCLFVFYRLLMFLFDNRDTAAAGTAVLGMSVLALSAVMMIRMYTLLMLFTVLFMALTARILREPDKPMLYIFLFLTTFGGFMTAYYFAFYAFFLTVTCLITFLCRRDGKAFLKYAFSVLGGLILMIIVFPSCLRQIFVGNGQVVGGTTVLDTLKNTAAFGEKIETYWKARLKLNGMKWVLTGSGIALLLLSPGLVRAVRKKNVSAQTLLLALPVVPAFLTVAVISPVLEQRYIYNLVPCAALFVAFVLSLLPLSFREIMIIPGKISVSREKLLNGVFGKLVLACAVFAALWSAKSMPPDNLYTEQPQFNELCSAHADSPCVYITDGYYAPVTQDLCQLRLFNSFFTTSDPASDKMTKYIGDADEVVLYIDVDSYWSSGYDPEEVIEVFRNKTGFTECSPLYTYSINGMEALSRTYILTR